jgi:alpha-1,2-mannosyltransferase
VRQSGTMPSPAEASRPGSQLLPVAAIAVLGVTLGLILFSAGDTLGYDYRAYEGAARRLLEGRPLYDSTVDVAGGFAIYLYPPPFALLALPFALLPGSLGVWAWIGGLLAAFLAGCWMLPVRRDVRWVTVLLGGAMWPLVYSIKLGQVGPLLFLAFALGWRWIDRPAPLGATIAAGALVKVQPLILLAWATATRRWGAVVVSIACLALAAVAITPFVGLGTWFDYVEILRRVSAPITTPHNSSPGAVLYQLGVPEAAALVGQLAAMALTVGIAAFAWFRARADASYLATVVASQLISPLLWDHYAMLLLLPVAYLIDRGRPWAAAIPLAMSVPLVWLVPAWAYPLAFLVTLAAVALARVELEPPPASAAA